MTITYRLVSALLLPSILLTGCNSQPVEETIKPAAGAATPSPLSEPTQTPATLELQQIQQGATLSPLPTPEATTAAAAATPQATPSGEPTQTAAAQARENPLANRPWGVYMGPAEQTTEPWYKATKAQKRVLRHIVKTPKAKWFGAWIPDSQIKSKTQEYVKATQQGDKSTLVQLTMFRSVPWEQETCKRLPTKKEKASYKTWTRNFAAGIGDAHAAVVLQPDGPFALCAPGGVGAPTRLIAYAAKTLSQQPNTSVYIEVGASDWPAPGQGGVPTVMKFLTKSGIQYAQGIALNTTHYASTANEIQRAADIAAALQKAGYGKKTAVINTSSNGKPFNYGDYRGSGRWESGNNARPCTSKTDPGTCVALGIKPTWKTYSKNHGLGERYRKLAREHVDAYLWFGKPWLEYQNTPFKMDKALAVVKAAPWWSN